MYVAWQCLSTIGLRVEPVIVHRSIVHIRLLRFSRISCLWLKAPGGKRRINVYSVCINHNSVEESLRSTSAHAELVWQVRVLPGKPRLSGMSRYLGGKMAESLRICSVYGKRVSAMSKLHGGNRQRVLSTELTLTLYHTGTTA